MACGKSLLLLAVWLMHVQASESSRVYRHIVNEEQVMQALLGSQPELLASFPLCVLEQEVEDGNDTVELVNEQRLTASEYYSLLRQRNSSALTVELGLSISQLLAVSEKEQTVTIAVRTSTEWTDCRLAWSPAAFNGVHNITVHPERFRNLGLFVPLVMLLEETNALASQGSETSVRVSASGRVTVLREYTSTVSCGLDVQLYPFDCHACFLTFETPFSSLETSLTYTLYDSVVAESRYLLADGRFIPSDTWEVIVLPPLASRRWTCSDLQRDRANELSSPNCFVDRQTYRVILRRHPHYQVVNLLIPAFLCLVLSTCIFMIPPGATDKLFLMLTILLSLFIFLNLMYDKMPETGSTLPWMSLYYFSCTLIVSVSCIVCSVTTTIAISQRPVPDCLRKAVIRCSCLLIGIIPLQNNEEDHRKRVDRECSQKCDATMLYRLSSNPSEIVQGDGCVETRLESETPVTTEPFEVTWSHVAAFVDRFYLIVVLVVALVQLAFFLLYGYFPPNGLYGLHLNESDWPYVKAELALQGDSDGLNV